MHIYLCMYVVCVGGFVCMYFLFFYLLVPGSYLSGETTGFFGLEVRVLPLPPPGCGEGQCVGSVPSGLATHSNLGVGGQFIS